MAMGALGQLLTELLLAVGVLSGYDLPAEPPDLAFVSHAELERQACDGPCEVYGWFPPGRRIYLDDRLDPLNDIADRSILVHELVHFLQREAGSFAPTGDCRSWMAREWQAYDIQLRWLRRQDAPRKALARIGFGPLRLSCPELAERPGRTLLGEPRAE